MTSADDGPRRAWAALPLFNAPPPSEAPVGEGLNPDRTWRAHVPARPPTRPGSTGAPPAAVTSRVAASPARARAAQPAVAPARDAGGVDWKLVRAFRRHVTEIAAREIAPSVNEPDRRAATQRIILETLHGHATAVAAHTPSPVVTRGAGTTDPEDFADSALSIWNPDLERRYAVAIFDSIFGLGRLQPLLNDPHVENIEIYGCDQVQLTYGDGTILTADPIADSDEDLIEDIRTIAARGAGGERSFTPAHPVVNVSLNDRFRLHAMGFGLVPRPTIIIRQHGLIDVDLDQLVSMDMLTPGLAQFLTAAVRAHRSIIVAGSQGAGKTTLLRALANAIPPEERIGTIESEYELLLHTLPHRHRRIVAMQARQGGGLLATDGSVAGEVTIDQLLIGSFRQNLSRIIVGEVLGGELWTMFQAMTASSGSLSTIHAKGGRHAIQRMTTLAAQHGGNTVLAERTVAENIDLVIFVDKVDLSWDGGPILRRVSEVLELRPGENDHTAVTHLFRPDENGMAEFRIHPTFLPELERAGYRPDAWGWTA